MLMRRLGRRSGYFIGALHRRRSAGASRRPASPSAASLVFCLGTFIAGFYASFVQSYRFAAADSASPGFKARAISWVMAGGLAAGDHRPADRDLDARPRPERAVRRRLPRPGGAGAPDHRSVSRFLQPAAGPPDAPRAAGGRSCEIMRQPRFLAAVAAGLVSYGLMSFVMTAAPLAMVECGHSVGDGGARHPMAHPRDVRPELRHRPADRPLRQGARHGGRARPDRGRGRDRPVRPLGGAFLARPGAARASAGTSPSSARRRW